MSPRSLQQKSTLTAPETEDILNREPVTEKAEVRHVLISWADLASNYGGHIDERGPGSKQGRCDQTGHSSFSSALAMARAL